MDPSTLNTFVVAIAIMAAVQAVVLIVLLVTTWKTSTRLQAVADQVEKKALPVLDSAGALLSESRGKLSGIVDDLSVMTAAARGQMERLDATVNDVLDRTRLQVIRADEMVSRTMDKVEETTEMVQHSVVSPVRQLAGLMQGVTAAVDALIGLKRKRGPREVRVPQDEELFI